MIKIKSGFFRLAEAEKQVGQRHAAKETYGKGVLSHFRNYKGPNSEAQSSQALSMVTNQNLEKD